VTTEQAAVPVRRMTGRRWAAAGAVLVVAAVAITVAVTDPFADPAPPEPSGTAYRTSTTTVTRRPLESQTQVDATLGYAGAYTVVNQAAGTVTWLPAAGRIVRQGQVLYRVSGHPVVLLYGPVPAYRDLAYGMKGRDVAELNTALRALGHDTRAHSDYFGLATVSAVSALQHHLGLSRTGELTLGQAVFLPGAARVTAHGAAVPGGPARPGVSLLSVTSTTPVVTIDLDAAQQTEVKRGNHVTVTLPSGRTTPGVVSSVGTVARTPKGASSPTVTVRVTLKNARAGGLDQAPVQVTIVTGRVRDALVVPVNALLAQTGGGYAVEVADPRGNHLVTVAPGLFDDADGLVQVSGAGLSAGQRVVVPAA
jgi:peptidoglycan hydrolase-like protein with peptidoglycan-binding domain